MVDSLGQVNDAPEPAAVSGVRLRTRQAIVSAAIAAWATDFSTSLGDIADRALLRRIGDGEFGLAVVEAVAHINCLAHRGLIAPVGVTNDGGTLWGA